MDPWLKGTDETVIGRTFSRSHDKRTLRWPSQQIDRHDWMITLREKISLIRNRTVTRPYDRLLLKISSRRQLVVKSCSATLLLDDSFFALDDEFFFNEVWFRSIRWKTSYHDQSLMTRSLETCAEKFSCPFPCSPQWEKWVNRHIVENMKEWLSETSPFRREDNFTRNEFTLTPKTLGICCKEDFPKSPLGRDRYDHCRCQRRLLRLRQYL